MQNATAAICNPGITTAAPSLDTANAQSAPAGRFTWMRWILRLPGDREPAQEELAP
jgi:hypothetical protein